MANLNPFRVSAYKRWAVGLPIVFFLQLAGCVPNEPGSTGDVPDAVVETAGSTDTVEESTSNSSEPSEGMGETTGDLETDDETAPDSDTSIVEAAESGDAAADESTALILSQASDLDAADLSENEAVCVNEESFETPDESHRYKTLVNLYHGGTKTKEETREIICSPAEIYRETQEKHAALPLSDRINLFRWYPEYPIRYLVMRDSDGDGILDVRVKEYGAFLPNDLDADNDGILNLMDARPLDGDSERDRASANDSDGDGLPDHLDWSHEEVVSAEDADEEVKRFDFSGDRENLIDKQLFAFQEFGVVLVEQDYPFSLPLVEMTLEVLEIFRPMMEAYQVKETLQSITMASKYGVNDFDVVAEVSPVNGQMILYGNTIERVTKQNPASIYTFAVYVHELTHVIQNAMDYSRNKQALLESNIHENPVAFVSAINDMGWTIKLDNKKNLPVHGYLKHGEESFAPREYYYDVLFSDFEDICEDWDEEKEKQWKKYNFPVCYATKSAREWHAEYVTATVLREIYAYIKDTYCMREKPFKCDADTIINTTTETGWENENDRYYLKNAKEGNMDLIAKQLKIPNNLLCRLSVKYAVAPALKIELDPDVECEES